MNSEDVLILTRGCGDNSDHQLPEPWTLTLQTTITLTPWNKHHKLQPPGNDADNFHGQI